MLKRPTPPNLADATVQALLDLADFIERSDDDLFMLAFQTHSYCGTTYCIAGHAIVQHMGTRDVWDAAIAQHTSPFYLAMQLLGLPEEIALSLFMSWERASENGYNFDRDSGNKHQACRTIRNLAYTGKVNWAA